MPYTIVKTVGGYKVQNKDTGRQYSDKAQRLRKAIAQLLILRRKTGEK